MDLDFSAILAADLDLVRSTVVVDLSLRDRATRVGSESGSSTFSEGFAADRLVVATLNPAVAGLERPPYHRVHFDASAI